MAILDQIRFGELIVRFNDNGGCQIYQTVFTEMIGFKVDRVFVQNFLNKYLIGESKIDEEVLKFFSDQVGYLEGKVAEKLKGSNK